MGRYILQKDLPKVMAGSFFTPTSALAYGYVDRERGIHIEYENYHIENNPEWFLPEKSPMQKAWKEYEQGFQKEQITGRYDFESGWMAAERYFKLQK